MAYNTSGAQTAGEAINQTYTHAFALQYPNPDHLPQFHQSSQTQLQPPCPAPDAGPNRFVYPTGNQIHFPLPLPLGVAEPIPPSLGYSPLPSSQSIRATSSSEHHPTHSSSAAGPSNGHGTSRQAIFGATPHEPPSNPDEDQAKEHVSIALEEEGSPDSTEMYLSQGAARDVGQGRLTGRGRGRGGRGSTGGTTKRGTTGRGRGRGRGRGTGNSPLISTGVDREGSMDLDGHGLGVHLSGRRELGERDQDRTTSGRMDVDGLGADDGDLKAEMNVSRASSVTFASASAVPSPIDPPGYGPSSTANIKLEPSESLPLGLTLGVNKLNEGAEAEAELTAIQYQRRRDTKDRARMGTKVLGSGSGGIGGGGYKYCLLAGRRKGLVEQGGPVKMEVDGEIEEGSSRGNKEEGFEGEECFLWTDLPMCKQSFRYVPCSPSPNESPSHLTHPFYRTLKQPSGPAPPLPSTSSKSAPLSDVMDQSVAPPVHLDWLDRSAYLKLSTSALTVIADKGFRSVRGNVSVREGAWYFEVVVERGGGEGCAPGLRVVNSQGSRTQVYGGANADGGQQTSSQMIDGAHVRLGWARREASLNGPCGLDGYSYGVRDSTGDKVTLSRPKAYGKPFGSGDVVGCLIYIPELDDLAQAHRENEIELDEWDPRNIMRKRIAIRYKDQLYFEMVDYATTKEMDGMVARDGKTAPMAPVPDLASLNGIDVTLGAGRAVGSPAKKAKAPGATTKNTVDGKAGKAVKRGRKKPQEDDIPPAPEVRARPVIPGSRISFFLNGEPMNDEDPAFTDVFDFRPLRQTALEIAARVSSKRLNFADAVQKERENPFDDGTLGYYPFLSCFGGARARFNAGPQWIAPVQEAAWNIGADKFGAPRCPRPMSSRWDDFVSEETNLDERDETALTRQLFKEKRNDADRRACLAERKIPNTSSKPVRGKGSRGRGKASRTAFSRDTPGSSPGPSTPASVPSQIASRAASPASSFHYDNLDPDAVAGEVFAVDIDAEGETEGDEDEDMDT